jgi:subtilisin family serine protease
VNQDFSKSSFSSTGPQLELVAPGRRIYTTAVNDDYTFFSGTSASTAFASGVAALIWAKNRDASNREVRNILSSTAMDLGSTGRDLEFGYGLINAKLALESIAS